MITWTEAQTKCQRISGDTTPTSLTQFKQDMNVGYHRFNADLGRYWSRKQQFTDVVANQSIYQTPVDSVRIIGMTVKTSTGNNTYAPPVKEIRSEYEWRLIKTVPNYASNWVTYYYVLGSDAIEIWPVPSDSIPNGIRFYYQQQDHDLSIEDITNVSTGATVTVTNGSETVTATSGIFTPNMVSLFFQLTGVNDLTWYEIVDVPTADTLTLKSAFVGLSGSTQSWRIGQSWIFPPEYGDVPVDYALARYYEAKNNKERAAYHRGNYELMVQDAVQEYSSSTEGNVIYEDGQEISPWVLTPLPPINP